MTKATAVAIDDYFNKRNNNVIMVVVVVQWSSYLPSAPSSNLLKFNSLSVKMLFGKDKILSVPSKKFKSRVCIVAFNSRNRNSMSSANFIVVMIFFAEK